MDEFEDVEPESEWADGGIEDEEDVEPWVAHEQPERRLAWGAWLCDCDGCRLALVAASVHEPRLPIVLKTGGDRVVVTAEYAAEVWQAMGGLEALCYVQRDHIREVFVGEWMPGRRSERWWSLSRARASKHAHGGLKYAVRSRSLRLGYADWPDNPRLPKGPLAVRPALRLVEGGRP